MRKVSHILETKGRRVVTVPQEAPVLEVIRLMAEHHIGSVLVMRGPDIIGIATERDYARKVILQGRSSGDTPVSAIMSSPVVCVTPDDSVSACMEIVTERKIRHLPVIENGVLLAFLSMRHIMEVLVEDNQFMVNQLLNYITGSGMATELAPPRAGIMGTLNADIQLGGRT